MGKLSGIRILVVEDNLLYQKIIKLILGKQGGEVTIAENGQRAIEILSFSEFDIILMDLNMPVMDGYETTDVIRNKLKNNIPILALTADVVTMDENNNHYSGMNGMISKSFEPGAFSELILKLLKR